MNERLEQLGKAIQECYKRLDTQTDFEYAATVTQIRFLEEQYKSASEKANGC